MRDKFDKLTDKEQELVHSLVDFWHTVPEGQLLDEAALEWLEEHEIVGVY